ncbi:hypothetical protein L1049_024161 [Liquidambar formosana]|uniref:EF-hand domain-containing protein n=1 Tax=Liquidambar formosana TaxID=63359 RepID=A0AAP0WYB7_LIQFO
MAISSRTQTRRVPNSGKHQMTVDEFKQWLKTFDKNEDGRISKKELQEAIRTSGGWFSAWKSARGVTEADVDQSGFIDDGEIGNLLEFAEKCMGVKIVPY